MKSWQTIDLVCTKGWERMKLTFEKWFSFFVQVYLWLLCPLSNSSHISSAMLLAPPGWYPIVSIYWDYNNICLILNQNPDIVLVHYLNVPYPDDNKLAVITPSLALWGEKKEWTKDELVSQLKPMCKDNFVFSFTDNIN